MHSWAVSPSREGKTAAWRAAAPVLAVLGWVIGVSLLMPQARLPGVPVLTLLMVGGVGLAMGVVWWAWRFPGTGHGWLGVGVLCAAACLAHGSTGLRTQERLQARLPHALEGVPLLVVGTVTELARRTPQGLQFTVEVEHVQGLGGEAVSGLPARLWLGWWHEGPIDAWMATGIPEPQPGERWQWPVSLKRPHGTQNPGSFDAERWFLEQDLGASGSVLAAHRGHARRLSQAVPPWRNPQAWRAAVRARIDAQVADPAVAGLIAGLTIGDQSAVSEADWNLFREAGVAHALSISGLHITLFAALAAPAVAWCWRQWPRACLWWPAPFAGAAFGGLLALAYALLAGWGLPAQRTVAMLAVVTLARLWRLNSAPLWVWCLAAAPVVVVDPWAIGQAGFWLSFAAVGLLLLSSAPSREDAVLTTEGTPLGAAAWPLGGRWRARARDWGAHMHQAVHTQVITSLGLAPLTAACFGQLSVVGVVGNLVAMPLITLLLTPLCMLGLLWPALWALVPWVLAPLRALMAALVSLPWAVVNVPGTELWALGLAVLGAALALLNLPWRVRLCGLVFMWPQLNPSVPTPPTGRFEAWALDVGQGSAVLVRTQSHSLLLDAGPAWGEGRDAGARVVVPVLRHLGVRRLDRLVITHRDLDHAGGAAAVFKALPVGALLSSLDPGHPLRRLPVSHQSCQRGLAWVWDGVQFEVLHPLGDLDPRAKPNTQSCVLRVQDAQGRALLMTGDIERDQEQTLVVADGDSTTTLRSEALVVPHHGSRTSSSEAFLAAVQARWAIAQTGHRNRFGHPAASVVQAHAQQGTELVSSPWCGAWRWDGQGPPQCWRLARPRHWHDQPLADVVAGPRR